MTITTTIFANIHNPKAAHDAGSVYCLRTEADGTIVAQNRNYRTLGVYHGSLADFVDDARLVSVWPDYDGCGRHAIWLSVGASPVDYTADDRARFARLLRGEVTQ